MIVLYCFSNAASSKSSSDYLELPFLRWADKFSQPAARWQELVPHVVQESCPGILGVTILNQRSYGFFGGER